MGQNWQIKDDSRSSGQSSKNNELRGAKSNIEITHSIIYHSLYFELLVSYSSFEVIQDAILFLFSMNNSHFWLIQVRTFARGPHIYHWDKYLSMISESKITLLYLNWILVACRSSWCLSTARGFYRSRGFRAKRKQNVSFPLKNDSSPHNYTWYLHWWHCYFTQMFCTIEYEQNVSEQTTRKSKCPSVSS